MIWMDDGEVSNSIKNIIVDPCSGAQQKPGGKEQKDIPCGGSANLHCQGGCIRSVDFLFVLLHLIII